MVSPCGTRRGGSSLGCLLSLLIFVAALYYGVHIGEVYLRYYRLLDAMRIFDLIYVLTPNSSGTKTMSVLARENLIEFDKFAYGSAQSTLLFLIIALMVVIYIWVGRVRFDGGDR